MITASDRILVLGDAGRAVLLAKRASWVKERAGPRGVERRLDWREVSAAGEVLGLVRVDQESDWRGDLDGARATAQFRPGRVRGHDGYGAEDIGGREDDGVGQLESRVAAAQLGSVAREIAREWLDADSEVGEESFGLCERGGAFSEGTHERLRVGAGRHDELVGAARGDGRHGASVVHVCGVQEGD